MSNYIKKIFPYENTFLKTHFAENFKLNNYINYKLNIYLII